jgi:hypothetical protein
MKMDLKSKYIVGYCFSRIKSLAVKGKKGRSSIAAADKVFEEIFLRKNFVSKVLSAYGVRELHDVFASVDYPALLEILRSDRAYAALVSLIKIRAKRKISKTSKKEDKLYKQGIASLIDVYHVRKPNESNYDELRSFIKRKKKKHDDDFGFGFEIESLFDDYDDDNDYEYDDGGDGDDFARFMRKVVGKSRNFEEEDLFDEPSPRRGRKPKKSDLENYEIEEADADYDDDDDESSEDGINTILKLVSGIDEKIDSTSSRLNDIEENVETLEDVVDQLVQKSVCTEGVVSQLMKRTNYNGYIPDDTPSVQAEATTSEEVSVKPDPKGNIITSDGNYSVE